LIRYYDKKDVADALLAEALEGIEFMQQSREMLLTFTQELGLMAIQAALNASASSIAGNPHPGVKGGEIRHWGSQSGSVRIGPAKTKVKRPRLRDKSGKEVEVPAYELLKKDPKAAKRVLRAALRGVSCRDYKEVVAGSAEAVGVSRSTVSRQVIEQSAAEVEALLTKPLEARMLAVVVDGIRFAGHLVVGAVGIDESGKKHFLGLSLGSTENSATVKSLLSGLRDRGLLPNTLFIIDGAKALRSAIKEVFGEQALIQRCRQHKKVNVINRMSQRKAPYVYAKMAAAYKLPAKEGIQRLQELASELEITHPGAAVSLREGLEETFTVSRIGLSPLLISSLGTSNILESVNSLVREKTRKLKNAVNGADVQRWACSAFLDAERSMRTLKGYKDLWMLRAALDDLALQQGVVA